MRGAVNDLLRWLIGHVLVLGGHWSARRAVRRMRGYRQEQRRLHAEYGLSEAIHPSGLLPEIGDSVSSKSAPEPRRAVTSGTTGQPKEVAYSRGRIRAVQRAFIGSFLRAYSALKPKRKSFYVLSSLQADQSLTSLMMEESGRFPPYLSGLQAPYRVQAHPVFQELEEQFGGTAVRVWVLVLANPGVLYCTNPSTLAAFIDSVGRDWERCRALLESEQRDRGDWPPALRACRRRLVSRGADERIARLLRLKGSPGLVEIVPALQLFSCWDGGHVGVFLERVRRHLEGSSVRHLPMYSMSTEVIATQPVFREEELVFLPMAPKVRYEFLPLGAEAAPSALLEAWELEEGTEYVMVVSNAYGLRRYLTDDVFLCQRCLSEFGLPDLRFRRRQGLAWSFTGEKLTGAQVQEALNKLRSASAEDLDCEWMSLVPTTHGGDKSPGYLLVVVGPQSAVPSGLARTLDTHLEGLNLEFSSKLGSGRLSPTEALGVSLPDFVAWAGGERHRQSWENQFKFSPLVPKLWDCEPQGDS